VPLAPPLAPPAAHQPGARPRSADVAALAIAVTGLVLAFVVVFVWRIGGVVLILHQGRGVHSGDLLAMPLVLPALAWARRWWAPATAERAPAHRALRGPAGTRAG
jgi:hypothetical protein